MREIMVSLAAALTLGCAPITGSAQSAADRAAGRAAQPAAGSADTGDATIIVAPEVLDGWNFLYRFITEVEFVLCLEGHRQDDAIHIDGFRLAQIEATSHSSVRYQPCTDDRYIGTAHNHPPVEKGSALCYRSVPDRQSFERDRRALVDVVLCGADRYIWVLRDGRVGGPGARGSPE